MSKKTDIIRKVVEETQDVSRLPEEDQASKFGAGPGDWKPVYAETPDELEARIAKLESRLDWLYRWTLSDRNGHKYYSPAFTERAKDDRFPLPDYDAPGGPRKPQSEP